ncbi:MAG TPA: RNA-binding protein, partial [Acidobacteriota bacterium]|nr:RNA-binding protein [Acidobacteriota bacterium]
MSNKRIFVGGLPYSTSDKELEELFSAHGTVESARIVTDRMTGRSRGFGFVEMSNEAEAN